MTLPKNFDEERTHELAVDTWLFEKIGALFTMIYRQKDIPSSSNGKFVWVLKIGNDAYRFSDSAAELQVLAVVRGLEIIRRAK